MLFPAIHLFIGVAVIMREIARLSRRGRLDSLSYIMVVFAIIYGFAPFVFHLANLAGYAHNWTPYLDYARQPYGIEVVLIIAAYLGLLAGWQIGGSLPVSRWRSVAQYEFAPDQRMVRRLVILAWGLLIVSCLLYLLWSKPYGGISGVYQHAIAIRGGWIDIINPFAFLKRFCRLALFSSYLFFALLHIGTMKLHRRLFIQAGFILSVVVSLNYLLVNGARLHLAFYCCIFIIAFLLIRHERPTISRLLPALAISLVLLYFGTTIFNAAYLRLDPQTSVDVAAGAPPASMTFLLDDFSFPVISGVTAVRAISREQVELRYGLDLVLGVAYMVPKQFAPQLPEKISAVNTELISPGKIGEIPVDLIALGVYNFGLFGPPLLAFLFALGGRCLQGMLSGMRLRVLRIVMLTVFGLYLAQSITYTDPVTMMYDGFALFFGLVLLYLIVLPNGPGRRLPAPSHVSSLRKGVVCPHNE